jgi:hypothetical protein
MTDLADFVLDFCRAQGGVVEPPTYGVYDVLLPDATAAQLGIDPWQRFAFDDASAAASNGVTLLTYGHPLVERMMEAARAVPACARFYVNDVRLDKTGLAALARDSLSFPNANLGEVPHTLEERAMFRYVRFNFKAALLTDEKREQLVSVLMDAQTGAAVDDFSAAEAHRLAETPAFTALPAAPAQWTAARDPLAPEPFRALLDRAARVAVDRLEAVITPLEKRAARHLELDRARLETYYAGLERDLERRLRRADAEAAEARRTSLESKLAATRADHAAKLADVEAKYHLRVELDLVNLAVIAQPKIMLPVRIENRQAGVTRHVVWDSLRHTIEPLVCDVCLRPGVKLFLCANNHLACGREACLAPQCVDCKRVYCRHCAAEVVTCVVCDRPVCQKSLNRCRECGRGTCHQHIGLCHAADGQPRRMGAVVAASETLSAPSAGAPTQRLPGKQAPKRKSPAPELAASAGYRVMVQIEKGQPFVIAFVLGKDDREVAQRQWVLMEWGIQVQCFCEKGWRCKSARRLLKPKSAAQIEAQLEAEIAQMCAEYHVPIYRLSLYTLQQGAPTRIPKLSLGGAWKDKALLEAARAGFPAEVDQSE